MADLHNLLIRLGTAMNYILIIFLCLVDPASGGTGDFARGVAGVTFSFTPELRDRGENGIPYIFVAPITEIEPAYQETWNGFIAMMDGIEEYNERYSTGVAGLTPELSIIVLILSVVWQQIAN